MLINAKKAPLTNRCIAQGQFSRTTLKTLPIYVSSNRIGERLSLFCTALLADDNKTFLFFFFFFFSLSPNIQKAIE